MSSPIPKTVIVTLTNTGDEITIKVNPPTLRVPHNKTQEFRIIWQAQPAGVTFPGYFNWKGGSGQPNVKLDPADPSKLISDPYIPTTASTWQYEFKVKNSTFTILVDPEVENLPPTGPGPIDPPGGGSGGGMGGGGGKPHNDE